MYIITDQIRQSTPAQELWTLFVSFPWPPPCLFFLETGLKSLLRLKLTTIRQQTPTLMTVTALYYA